jgi:colicin import membrane protein
VAVGLLFFWSPQISRAPAPLAGAVVVDLVAAAPAAAPAARPAPRRAAPRKTVVLPKEPKAVVEPKPKPKPRPKAKPKPAPKAKPRPEPTPQKSLDDVMRELQRKAGPADEVVPRPRQVARAGAVAGAAGSGTARVDPATAGWLRRARIHVRRGWVLAPGFRTQDLEAHVQVRLDARGNVVGEPRITRRSGNPWYDDSVVRAIQKSSPLPAPPEAGDWPFVFRPEDIL